MAENVFVTPGGNFFVQPGATWLRREEQETAFCKGLLLLGGKFMLLRDSLRSYVDDAELFGESPAKDLAFLWTCEGGNERHIMGRRD